MILSASLLGRRREGLGGRGEIKSRGPSLTCLSWLGRADEERAEKFVEGFDAPNSSRPAALSSLWSLEYRGIRFRSIRDEVGLAKVTLLVL